MATLDVNIPSLSPSEHQVQLRRAVIASIIGTAIEWYDFFSHRPRLHQPVLLHPDLCIGIWGAVTLTLLRFLGIGGGGEWGGSVLMSMEWARTDHPRGFIAPWPDFGVPCGLFLANLAVLALLTWGWRILEAPSARKRVGPVPTFCR